MEYEQACTKTCRHKESVSGACGHDLEQALAASFAENPDQGCPFAPE